MKNIVSKLIFSVCAFIFVSSCVLCITAETAKAQPANELCTDAIGPLAVPSTTAGTTIAAIIDDLVAPFCVTSVTSPGVWYTVIGTGNTMTVSTCNDATFDNKISVYCADCPSLICVNGNDDAIGCAGFTAELDFCSVEGAEYKILVHGFGGASGNFNLTITNDGNPCTGAVGCPVFAATTIQKAGTGSGTVTSTPAGIDCGSDCSEDYLLDEEVTLSATADPSSAFDGWSGGGCSGNGECTVLIDEDVAITATFNPDSDNDGISDVVEDAGSGDGDGNGDGIADSQQSDVTTFQNIYGDFVTLVSEDGTELRDVITTMDSSDADMSDWASFPAGLFGFKITGLSPGQTTTLLIILHEKNEDISTYYKYGATPDNHTEHWYEFIYYGGVGAVINQQDTGTEILLYFIDGQKGDDDLLGNGEINDVGGPKIQAGEGGGKNKSCFIATAAYGSSMDEDVKLLKEFRDSFLLTNTAGKIFVDLYYRYSPPVAEFIARHDTLRAVVRYSLIPLISASRLTK